MDYAGNIRYRWLNLHNVGDVCNFWYHFDDGYLAVMPAQTSPTAYHYIPSYHYQVRDHQGNIRVMVDEVGNLGYVAYSTEVQMPNENNVYIQNQTFTSNATIVGDNIYIGRDVDLTQQTGDVIVNNGTLNVQGNNKVVIKNGFKVNLGANLKIN
jgi:hypothetical protein